MLPSAYQGRSTSNSRWTRSTICDSLRLGLGGRKLLFDSSNHEDNYDSGPPQALVLRRLVSKRLLYFRILKPCNARPENSCMPFSFSAASMLAPLKSST